MRPLTLFAALALAAPAAAAGPRWQTFRDDPAGLEQVALVGDDGRQLGVYWPVSGEFYSLEAGKWSGPHRPPVEPPALDFGCEYRGPSAGARYSVSGRPATREEVLGLLAGRGHARHAEAPQVPDKSARLRVVVIGSEEERGAAVQALVGHPGFSAYRDRVIVQGYAPDAWEVAECGYRTDGHPTVCVVAPDGPVHGKVLHRQDDFAGGADALLAVLARLLPAAGPRAERGPDPGYDPAKDPDLRKAAPPAPGPGPAPLDVPPYAGGLLMLGGAAALLALTARRAARRARPAPVTAKEPQP